MPGGRGSGVRAHKAAQTRSRMLSGARTLFIERGYAATTMQAIAKEAGVAVQTLYFTFATKRALLKELLDVEIAGDEQPIATLDRPWMARVLAAPPVEQIQGTVRASAQILHRVAPVLGVVRSAAAVDPEISQLWKINLEQRRSVQLVLMKALAGKTPLRGGLTPGRAADICMAILAPESFQLLIEERGWSITTWREWAAGLLVEQLLP